MKICVFFIHIVLSIIKKYRDILEIKIKILFLFDIIKYKCIIGIKLFLGQKLLLVPF